MTATTVGPAETYAHASAVRARKTGGTSLLVNKLDRTGESLGGSSRTMRRQALSPRPGVHGQRAQVDNPQGGDAHRSASPVMGVGGRWVMSDRSSQERAMGMTKRRDCSRSLRVAWLPEEDEVIRSRWPQEGWEGCHMLARRTQKAIQKRAEALGVRMLPKALDAVRHKPEPPQVKAKKAATARAQQAQKSRRGIAHHRATRHEKFMTSAGPAVARPPRVSSVFQLGDMEVA